MIPTQTDLIASTDKYKKYHYDANCLFIFNNIIRRPDNLIKMAEVSNAGLPALAAIVTEIETYFDSISTPTFDISNDDFAKTYIGRMISIVLSELGFKKVSKTRMPKSANSKYFSSASRFELLEPNSASLKIEKRLIDIATNKALT